MPLLLDTRLHKQLWVQAKLLDVAEHHESGTGVFFLLKLIALLTLDQERVQLLLDRGQGQPHDQICLQGQLCHLQLSTESLCGTDREDVVFGSAQEVVFVHFS